MKDVAAPQPSGTRLVDVSRRDHNRAFKKRAVRSLRSDRTQIPSPSMTVRIVERIVATWSEGTVRRDHLEKSFAITAGLSAITSHSGEDLSRSVHCVGAMGSLSFASLSRLPAADDNVGKEIDCEP